MKRSSVRHECPPIKALVLVVLAFFISGCSGTRGLKPVADPDEARSRIERLLPSGVSNAKAWAYDFFAALEALNLAASNENACAAIAVVQQESTFQANPPVPGLGKIARQEIDDRAKRFRVPRFLVNVALEIESPNGKTYAQRLSAAKTEQELSDIFEDFSAIVPLGRRLFADFNPVRTGGPMQVSIAFAEEHARRKRYPYPVQDTIRREVFTRRGGLYFGIAHLLDYPAEYTDMVYRFADFNAGHYASRNAAFQNALNVATQSKLVLDGDLIIHGSDAPSRTELAARKLADGIEMSTDAIRRDLERGQEGSFGSTTLYRRVFEKADSLRKSPVPRAIIPTIRLKSPKITRNLTTEWFAKRVKTRYEQCLRRGLRTEG